MNPGKGLTGPPQSGEQYNRDRRMSEPIAKSEVAAATKVMKRGSVLNLVKMKYVI